MEKKNVLREKSYAFALDIVHFYKELEKGKEYVLSKQLLRAGTSIGANVEEANFAQSKREFISKLHISLRESHESHFWLRLIRDANYASQNEMDHLFKKVKELIALLTAIIKTSKNSLEE